MLPGHRCFPPLLLPSRTLRSPKLHRLPLESSSAAMDVWDLSLLHLLLKDAPQMLVDFGLETGLATPAPVSSASLARCWSTGGVLGAMCLCAPHLVAAAHIWHHLNQISQVTGTLLQQALFFFFLFLVHCIHFFKYRGAQQWVPLNGLDKTHPTQLYTLPHHSDIGINLAVCLSRQRRSQ